MKLAPRIIQAMEILQLPMLALLERIEAEMESNPVLEIRDAGVDEQAPIQRDDEGPPLDQPLVVQDQAGHAEDFERLAEFENENEPWTFRGEGSPRASSGDRDKKMDAMANAPAPDQSLDEYLLDQWAFVEATPQIKLAGELIISNIDDDGYLRTPLEELSGQAGQADVADQTGKDNPPIAVPITVQALQAAIKLVQTLEPVGVAARDLRECLLLQLRAQAQAGQDVALEQLLVDRYLRDIEMNRLPSIARRTNKSLDQIKAALVVISHLNPRPGLMVGQRSAPVITPDIAVDLDDAGQAVVTMTDGNTPALYISKGYRKLARDRTANRDARQFLQRNIRSAQWLIGAIQQRRETVRRVTEEVFKVQKEFLTTGPEALKPLPMTDIAVKVGVHVATVSRAVSGKYVQTPRGIFPLRMFFSGGTTTAGGDDVSWDAVRVKLSEIVLAEDKASPLNDDELAEALDKHGIKVARRTVAKYRGLLNIPPARKRKLF
jgi:RNA polymerase sigma-54 factor